MYKWFYIVGVPCGSQTGSMV